MIHTSGYLQTADYNLSIVSKNNNEKHFLKTFRINEEDVIGVKKNELFEIIFRNNTHTDVQVRISIDGTDVITGDKSSTKPSGQMWLVKPNSSLELKAWPETNHGGSSFIFTDPDKGVSKNTHGDVSKVGLITAAVYVESGYDWRRLSQQFNFIPAVYSPQYNAQSLSFAPSRSKILRASNVNLDSMISDNSLAVGAGEFTNQNISKETGLLKPVLNDILQVRYVSWDKLIKTLYKSQTIVKPKVELKIKEKRINLKNVEKITHKETTSRFV